MNLNYMKRGFMLLGAAAMTTAASAEFVDVTNKYLKDPAYIPGWQGVITGHAEGVAEVWNAAFRAYQTINNLPAGKYTLTCNAMYRCGNNEFAKEHMSAATPELYTAYIFAGNAKKTVAGLFDGGKGFEDWDNWNPATMAPNSLYAANQAFEAGEYVNTLEFDHPGGTLVLGICNTGCYQDEWCAFDNFKLAGPDGEIAIPNGDFAEGLDSKRSWDNHNMDNGEKTPDMQKDGSSGGAYRKTGASPYNYGQQVTLPAGTYRFGMQCLHRYGSTQNSENGEYYHHKSGEVSEPYGRVPRTPKQWFEANDYEDQTTYDHAYIYMSYNQEKPKDLNLADDFGDLGENDVRVRVKDAWEICNGNVAEMPDNNTYGKDATLPYETKNKCIDWHDSGRERESAAAFVADPEKWYQYVEFTLDKESTVWLGMGKNTNTSDGFWHSWANQTLYMEEGNGEQPGNDDNGEFEDVTNLYLKEPSYLPGWQGVISKTADGVAEVWSGAFRAYQKINNLPAGEYTLSCNAFYRCGNNDFSKLNMPGNPDLYTAYIFAGDAKKTVAGLFDGGRETAPNNTWEANDAFAAGDYLNELKFTHNGGDLTIGICNTGCYDDEWCCFDNFKLTGPNGEVAIENGDFSTGIDAKRAWNNLNFDNGEKTPDMQKDGSGGGDFRKCGGSPYNYGQQVALPAGTYRFGMQCFHRYGSTQNPETGAYYHHKSGEVVEPYGRVPRTPKQWWEANDYEDQATYDHAYIYMSFNEEKPKDLNFEEDFGDLGENDMRVRVKDVWEICNGNVAVMPDNNIYGPGAELPYETKNKCIWWHDSGNEREAAAAFVAEPEKYYQYVEFTLDEPATVWVGMGKNSNTSDGYWHAWANQTLYKKGNNNAVESVQPEFTGAPEYYTLQGVRVANPQGGIFIVREGNKTYKQVIR